MMIRAGRIATPPGRVPAILAEAWKKSKGAYLPG